MRRGTVLCAVVAAGALSIGVAAYQGQPQGPKTIEVEKVRDNLYLLKGGGGNTAVFVASKGVVVVDTKLPGWGEPILDEIKKITDKPVTTIINTHTHGDHVSGNVEFPATVDIVTQEHTAANMRKMASPPGMASAQSVFQESGGKGLAKRTFTDSMTLMSGADRIELRYFGAGHTNGDAWVIFPALRVAHAGDLFAGKTPPLIDTNNGGSGVAFPKTLAEAVSGIKGVDQIITGHSTVMTWPDLQEYADFNKDFLDWTTAQLKAGKSIDEAAAAYQLPAKYAGYSAQPARVKANVTAIYAELKK